MKRLCISLVLLVVACSHHGNAVIAGLHSAGAAVYLDGSGGEHVIPVGTKLRSSDHLRATGPAVIEYFKGGTHFLDHESFTVGDAREARILGATLPVRRITANGIVPIEGIGLLVAPRYTDVRSTPPMARPRTLTQADYMVAFFTPNGIENLQKGPLPDGPREPLPPPPQRPRVPHMHAGELGGGGPIVDVRDGFVAAETGDLATAILLHGHRYALGQTDRLLLPPGAGALLETTHGKWALQGPLDLRLH